jgi:membrane protein required for colicin V production
LILFDIVLVLVLALSAFHGYKAGFLMELFSLFAAVLGILIGFKLMGLAMVLVADRFGVKENVLPYVAFGVVFVVVVIAVSMLGKLVAVAVGRSILGGADGVVAAMLALVRTAFMLSIVLWIVDSLGFRMIARFTEDSVVYPFLEDFAPAITRAISKVLPVFKDVF